MPAGSSGPMPADGAIECLFSLASLSTRQHATGAMTGMGGAPWQGGAFQWVRGPPGDSLQPRPAVERPPGLVPRRLRTHLGAHRNYDIASGNVSPR